jgi:antitoxin FitA
LFLLEVRPFNPLIDIVNAPWRGVKPPKRHLPPADGAGTPATIGFCSRVDRGSLDINAVTAIIEIMASITIRNLDENTKVLLRTRAVQNGRSMEEEVRVILTKTVTPGELKRGLGTAIHELFKAVGGADDLPIMPRPANRPPPDFQEW